MGMQVGSSAAGDAEPIVDMNTTPLIDVMLVLLVMPSPSRSSFTRST
jgi:biopolymer transport protein ExbD